VRRSERSRGLEEQLAAAQERIAQLEAKVATATQRGREVESEDITRLREKVAALERENAEL
jgi:polyhydroxyalkanoate synthesis regulator phasin